MNYIHEKRGLYRSRRGLLFGVCRGIAECLDISVFWTRIALVITCLLTGFWPVAAVYLLLAALLKRSPIVGTSDWCPVMANASQACRHAADTLDERLHRMQAAMRPDMDDDWDARLREKR